MADLSPAGLERLCGPNAPDWIRTAPEGRGLERIEAVFSTFTFEPHRHDTYSIGFTVRGVQTTRYRGGSIRCLPGQVFVLHPDERHDGRAATNEGLRYRTLYVEPAAIREALDEPGCPLPFVREAISNHPGLAAAIEQPLADLDRPLEDLELDQVLVDIADALDDAGQCGARRKLPSRHWRAVGRARELLDARVGTGVTSAELEAATGETRYALARQFRACLGTTPYRYLVLRRLDRVRAMLRSGTSLAEAALSCGFADQSHMTRQFKRAYGLAPGRWAAMVGAGGVRA
jgi:AraC-like DNA-binding protein